MKALIASAGRYRKNLLYAIMFLLRHRKTRIAVSKRTLKFENRIAKHNKLINNEPHIVAVPFYFELVESNLHELRIGISESNCSCCDFLFNSCAWS